MPPVRLGDIRFEPELPGCVPWKRWYAVPFAMGFLSGCNRWLISIVELSSSVGTLKCQLGDR